MFVSPSVFRSLSMAMLVAIALPFLSPLSMASEDGNTWMQKLDHANRNPAESMTVEMSIQRPDGSTLQRTFALDSWSDGKQSARLLSFSAPADLRGTALLTWTRPKSEDRWYHAPTLGTRRIGLTDQREPFVQSDLTIEDLTVSYDPANRTYTVLRTEELAGRTCVVVEDRPSNDKAARASGYQKVLLWIDTERIVSPKIEFYDTSGTLMKVLVAKEPVSVAGTWRYGASIVSNLLTGSQTTLTVKNRTLPATLDAGHFSVEALDEN